MRVFRARLACGEGAHPRLIREGWLPSGDQTGASSEPGVSVSRRTAPSATLTVKRS